MKTVIKFSMEFCQPCKQLKPIFEDVISNLTDIKVVEIDVERNIQILQVITELGVSLCVIVTDENDNVFAMKTGMMTKEQLKDLILRC